MPDVLVLMALALRQLARRRRPELRRRDWDGDVAGRTG